MCFLSWKSQDAKALEPIFGVGTAVEQRGDDDHPDDHCSPATGTLEKSPRIKDESCDMLVIDSKHLCYGTF